MPASGTSVQVTTMQLFPHRTLATTKHRYAFTECGPRVFLTLAIVFADFGLSPAAEDTSSKPILRIETGMHINPITSISSDATGQIALTVSSDSARLWALPSGRPLRVLRPPISNGSPPTRALGALSSDGTTAVVTTVDAGSVYAFETSTGKMIGVLDRTVNSLALSKSGRFVAAIDSSRSSLIVWSVASGRWTEVDHKGFAENFLGGIDWHGDDRIATGTNGKLELYKLPKNFDSASGKLPEIPSPVSATLPNGEVPSSIRFSPDGEKIAVAFSYYSSLAVMGSTDLKLLFTLGSIKRSGNAQGAATLLAWGSDGSSLAAWGSLHKAVSGSEMSVIRCWKQSGKGQPEDIAISRTGAVTDVCPVAGKGFLFSTSEPSWGLVDAGGAVSTLASSLQFHYWNHDGNLLVSPDGSEVQSSGARPLRFSVSARVISIMPQNAPPENLLPTTTKGLNITDWRNDPKLNGVSMGGVFPARALAIARDSSFFLLGGDERIQSVDGAGWTNWKKYTVSVEALNIATDRKLSVVAYADGTIRWYNQLGRELLAFFAHADGRHWVMWAGSGYYDASPGGEDLIGWYISTDKQKAAEFLPISRFRDTYYRPDVIDRVLDSRDSSEALQRANEAAGKKQGGEADVASTINQKQPPSVELLVGGAQKKVEIAAGVSGVTLRYRVRKGAANEQITRVHVMIDGRPSLVDAPIPKDDDTIASTDVPVPAFDCSVSVLADNRFTSSEAAVLEVIRRGNAAVTAGGGKPRLFVLAVGINHYSNSSIIKDLPYSVKAATDFTAVMEKQQGQLYSAVEKRLLTDEEATAGNIIDGFDWLRQRTGPDDIAMVFIATHGGNDSNLHYYFCAHDFDPERLLRTTVSFEEIQRVVNSIPGKIVFFLDTCHAGNALGKLSGATGPVADTNRVINELSSDQNGAVVFAASSGREVSWQGGKWTRGLFTQALIEGIEGKADLLGKGKITVASLETYIAARVPDLFKEEIAQSKEARKEGSTAQTPTVAKPQTIPDFTIAMRSGGKK